MGIIMMTLGRVLGFAATLIFVSACGGGGGGSGDSGGGTQPPTTFTVSTSATGTGSGTLSPTSRSVTQGSTTSFTISPAAGSTIASVSGCGGSLSGTTYTTGPITTACSVTANFSQSGTTSPPTSYAVATAVSGSGGGSISPSAVNVIPGGSATFNLFPNADSVLSAISGCGGTLVGSSYTTNAIQASCTVTATFDLKQYTVSTSFGQGGVIDPALRLVNHGSTTTFAVVPNTGFSIDQVTGCGGTFANGAFTTAPITNDCTISATFAINQYSVLASAGENGTISPHATMVDHGQVATFTVIPDVGYTVETIGGCNGSLDATVYRTAPVISSCDVSVSFMPLTTVGHWDVKVLGAIEPYTEIFPRILSEDGGVLIGATQYYDVATSGYVQVGFVWNELEGFTVLLLDGHHQSSASFLSSDGTTVGGESCPEGAIRCTSFVWTEGRGLAPLILELDSYSQLYGMSTDGNVIWGQSCNSTRCRNFLWTNTDGIGEFIIDGVNAFAFAATPDGSVIVGSVGSDAMRWNRNTGIVDRFRLDGDTYALARDVSADGTVVIGQSQSGRGFVWTAGTGIQVLMPAGSTDSTALEISADGSTVIGEHSGPGYFYLYLWKPMTGFEDLVLTGDNFSQYIYPLSPSVSINGSRVMGRSCYTARQDGCTGIVWTQEQGTEALLWNVDRTNSSVQPESMSADGRRIVGGYWTSEESGSFLWTLEKGLEQLILHQFPVIISADGSTIAGPLCNGVTCELALLIERE